jgi:hypothetical protein
MVMGELVFMGIADTASVGTDLSNYLKRAGPVVIGGG